MGKITLLLGGARSGKSAFAERLAAECSEVTYFATAEARDDEMAERIKRHREARDLSWRTIEASRGLGSTFAEAMTGEGAAIVDCLTVYVSNLLGAGAHDEDILEEVVRLIEACRKFVGSTFIVSNEVGLGIVPDNKLARRYRDILGKANQAVVAEADDVYLLTAGIPLKIK